jgi:hypothetical protein
VNYTGNIKNTLGEPLMGANVSAQSKRGLVGVISDFDGNFNWNPETELTSPITVSYVGYQSETLDPSEVVDKQIVLKESMEQLDEVVVIAKRPKSQKGIDKNNLIGIISAGAGLLAIGILLVKFNK